MEQFCAMVDHGVMGGGKYDEKVKTKVVWKGFIAG